VSSIGNAVSLRGGSLLMAPLRGADGQIYAIAQGNLIVGGFGAQGKDGSRVSVNVPSVGRIPNGATVSERARPAGQWRHAEPAQQRFTVSRMVAALNNAFGEGAARAVDGVTVAVTAPTDPAHASACWPASRTWN
jgi:flagellar P-ring protein precursor FlgI